MAETIKVVEYKDEGFAIVEDTKGKYVASNRSPDIIPLYDYEAYFGRGTPCALLQSRTAMLT